MAEGRGPRPPGGEGHSSGDFDFNGNSRDNSGEGDRAIDKIVRIYGQKILNAEAREGRLSANQNGHTAMHSGVGKWRVGCATRQGDRKDLRIRGCPTAPRGHAALFLASDEARFITG